MGVLGRLKGDNKHEEIIDGLLFQIKMITDTDINTMQVMADKLATFFHDDNEISSYFKTGATRFFANETGVLDVEVTLSGISYLERDNYLQLKEAYIEWLHYSAGMMGMELGQINSYAITQKGKDTQTYLIRDPVQSNLSK